MKLTSQAAHNLKPGESLKCHVVRGLELRAGATGKSWQFYFRSLANDRRRPKLGEFPTMGIEAAREAAKAMQQAVWRGEDPSADRQASRVTPTVATAAHAYLEAQERAERKPRTLEENRRHVRLHILPRLGRLRVEHVTKAQIDDTLRKIAKTAPVGVNRIADTLSGIFRHAGRTGDANPVKGTFRGKERIRRRHATAKECIAISRELAALREAFPERVAALLVILFAGTRVTELITARKNQRHGNQLILSEHKTDRTGDDRVIFLPDQAVKIIDSLPDDGSEYVFGAGLNRRQIFWCWQLARRNADCPDLQVLDLRRTFASAAKSRGVDLESIGQVFGHKDVDTTRRYAWLFDDAAERMVQATADELEQRMLPKP